ncbi:MAG: DUF3108 domain-containing protein [Deltaproteobacteria bacterium HGW-Deltaproteobacteria-8]|jgi:hypothetical protein|nr:MAG: DUF3108 domain-containing protein [Deltaproteobacteria bacterium HGW-Deltaproteobacteria-8]
MKRLAAFALLLVLLAAHPAQAEYPFAAGEKLTYDLFWTFIHAGTATLETLPGTEAEGKPALHIRALAKSTPFIDKFYRVRDEIQSWVDPGVTRALLYQKDQSEGDYVRHYLIRFNPQGNMAFRYSKGALKNAVRTEPGTFDPLSMLFLFRTKPLALGYEFAAPVTDGDKAVVGKARVVKRETITTKAGEFDTFLVEPEVKEIGGVFRKSPDAKLQVWITTDERRIPVRVKSKVVVGAFYMDLTGYEGPQPKPLQTRQERP